MNADQATATALLAGNGVALLKIVDLVVDNRVPGIPIADVVITVIALVGVCAAFFAYTTAYMSKPPTPAFLNMIRIAGLALILVGGAVFARAVQNAVG